MTEDFTQAASKYALPRGMGNLAARITVGKSFFGYDLKQDGLPEVVVRAYARIGSDGVVAIARLAHEVGQPVLAEATALTEWGIEHYAGHVALSEADIRPVDPTVEQLLGLASAGTWQPEWVARGQLLRALSERTWGAKIRTIEGAPEDWPDWIDWPRMADKEAQAGKITFVEHEQKMTGSPTVYEVDMFEGRWEGAGK